MMIRCQAVLDSARGAPCTARFTGICNCDPATTVWCHLNGHRFGKGGAIKAHDILGFHGCSECHRYYDVGHGTRPILSELELIWAVLGAVTATWVRLIQTDVIKVPLDKLKPAHERPVKPRKSKDERVKIVGRNDAWAQGRKLPSRPMRIKP
jgi:hypothetical protein